MGDQDEHPPEPIPLTEVEISVAGHTIIVKAPEPMAEVAAQALGLFQQTTLEAKRSTIGFDVTGAQIERADPYRGDQPLEDWETEDRDGAAQAVGRQHP